MYISCNNSGHPRVGDGVLSVIGRTYGERAEIDIGRHYRDIGLCRRYSDLAGVERTSDRHGVEWRTSLDLRRSTWRTACI